MKRRLSAILAAILLNLIFVVPNGVIGWTHGPQDQPDLTLEVVTRTEVIKGVLKSSSILPPSLLAATLAGRR
jgi:hypothetical protein